MDREERQPAGTKPPRQAQLVRQWRILVELTRHPEGRSVPLLRRELGVNVRTLYRDLATVKAAGFRVTRARQRNQSVYRLADRAPLALGFTRDEIASLALATHAVLGFHGTPFHEPMTRAIRKIEGLARREDATSFAEVSGRFEGGMRRARRYARQEVWFRTVVAGIERQRTVRLAYFTLERRETTTRDVDPYGLVMHEGAFYLVGFCHLRRDRRTFLMDRVRSAVLTDRRFTRPEGFSPREHLRQAWGVVRAKSLVTVRVRFDRAVAPIIEEGRWHESQRVRPGPEGAVELTVQVAGWDEIRRWIMTFGGTAEVLEPPELRAELKREAAALAARYR